MGTRGGGTVLIAVGYPNSIESAFAEFSSAAAGNETVLA